VHSAAFPGSPVRNGACRQAPPCWPVSGLANQHPPPSQCAFKAPVASRRMQKKLSFAVPLRGQRRLTQGLSDFPFNIGREHACMHQRAAVYQRAFSIVNEGCKSRSSIAPLICTTSINVHHFQMNRKSPQPLDITYGFFHLISIQRPVTPTHVRQYQGAIRHPGK
jgi:hypothetical protein